MSKLGMVSSFHPHSMCKRVERVTAKVGRTSCTNWTIFFGVSGFRTRTHLLHWHFIFFKLITTPDFFEFRKNHSKRRHQFSKLSDIICYFSVIYRFVYGSKWPWNWKSLQKWTLKMSKLSMVSSFHPHSMCKRVERVTAKTGRTSCTNWTISFGVSGFRTRTHLLHGHFNVFKLIWTPDFFCVQYAAFKATSSISNMFLHHLLFSVIYLIV